MIRLTSPLLALLLLACNGDKTTNGGGDDTSGGGDDTGGGGDDTGGGDTWSYEEGCISVSGLSGGTFASIEDAVGAASAGDTVDLSLCKGEMTLTATLDVAVALTITGRGSETNTIVGPADGPAIAMTAADAAIEGLTVVSSASGVEVVANNVVLTDIIVDASGDWGLAASGADNLQLFEVTLSNNPTGGMYLSGGGATLTDVSITDNVAFGLYADNTDITLVGGEVSRNVWSDATAQGDGLGALVTGGGEMILDGTVFEDNDLINVYANTSSTADVRNSTLIGSLYSVYSNEGTIAITDSEIIDGINHGIYAFSDEPVVISGLTLSGDYKTTTDMLDEDWSVDGIYYGTGALIVSDDIQITDSTFEGYNNCGALLAEKNTDAGVATLERVDFVDNGRRGLYGLTNTVAIDVNVSGIIEVEDQGFTDGGPCSDAGNYVGVLMGSSTLDWSGGTLTDNAGYGISGLYADLTVDGLTASSNRCSSILNYYGAANISNSDFSFPGIGTDFSASVVDFYSTETTITDSTFSDSQTSFDDVTNYTSGGSTYQYIYYETAGMDVYSYYGGNLTITGSSFTDGVQGLYLFNTPATIDTNTWSGYRQVLYTTGEPVTFSNNAVDGFTDEGIYCSSGEIEIEDSTFANGTSESVAYDYYVNSVLTDTGTTEYTAYGTRLYSCAATIQDVSYTDLEGQAIYTSDYYEGDYEISNLTIDTVGTATDSNSAIYLYNYSYSYPTTVWMSNVSVTGASSGSALSALATSYGPMSLEVIGLTVDGAAGDGITLEGELLTATISYADITDAGNFGLTSDEATTSFRDSTIDASGTSGAQLLSGTDIEFADNIVSGSGEYGLVCGSVTITDCSGNDLSGNTSGTALSCPTECDEE